MGLMGLTWVEMSWQLLPLNRIEYWFRRNLDAWQTEDGCTNRSASGSQASRPEELL